MAPPEEMGFKFIQQVQQRESRSHNLTKLPADFFEGLAREEAAKDPMSTTATLVQNELKSTLRLAQDIVSLRLRKMANRAVDSLEGGKIDLRSLTPSERDVYADLSRILAAANEHMTPDRGTPSRRAGAPAVHAVPPGPEATPGTALDEGPGAASEPAPVEGGAMEERALVHMLEDVPSFAGEGGRTYSLKRGDMVSLPDRLVEVLVGRGMAERVERDAG
jgi:DNA replication factor GINS